MTVSKVILIEGLVNLIILITKAIVGATTGSVAIISDALHSLTDVANNFVAWAIVKHAQKPADREHPYGHHKFETLAVLGLAVLLLVLALELVINALKPSSQVPESSTLELAVMSGVLLINVSLATWQNFWAKKLKSDILKADASHTFADVLTTIVVIAGWQLSVMGYPILDKLCAIGVAVVIVMMAFGLIKKALPVLVDEYAVAPEKIAKLAKSQDDIKEVTRVRSRWVGNTATLDMIIKVSADLTTQQAHKICDELEQEIEKHYAISDISIHVEPY